MASINELLKERKLELQNMLKQVDTILKDAPEGRLRISHVRKTNTYFLCGTDPSKDRKNTGVYLRRDQVALIRKLAQKGYLQQIRNELKKQLHFLDQRTPDLSDAPILAVFNHLSEARKQLVTPLIDDDASFSARWQAVTYNSRTFPLGSPEYITERGERVLSKSEKILADKFYRMSIPYHYEKPLNLPDFGWIRPDFTLLNVHTRQEFYWEHLGMVDSAAYVEENVKRLNAYIKAGIIPGKNLILTWETKNSPLDWRVVETLINTFLI